MIYLKSLFSLTIFLFLSQCISDKEKEQATVSSNPNEAKKVNVKLRDDSFSVGSLVFLGQPLDTSARLSVSCPKGYQPDHDNDILRQMVDVYKIQQDVSSYVFDSAFFTRFIIDEPKTSFETMDTSYHLGAPIIREVEIANYGRCVIGSFQLDWASSAVQEFPTIVINRSKREAALWFFNDFKVRKGIIEVDLKVRNYKHALILAQYDTISKSFVVTCSRAVIDEGYE